MLIIVLGQHVSILIESYSGPSKKIDPYSAMFTNALLDPKPKRLGSNSAFVNILSKDLFS